MTSIPDSPWPYLIEKLRNARNISFSSFSIIKVWRVMKLYFHSHDDEQMLGLRILVEIKKYLLITSAKMTWTRRFNCIRLHCKWSCCSNACVTFFVFRTYRPKKLTDWFKIFRKSKLIQGGPKKNEECMPEHNLSWGSRKKLLFSEFVDNSWGYNHWNF